MLDHLFDMHDVSVFVMEIEQIDLVAQERSVIGAFLDDNIVESVGISVNRARTNATRGALAANDQALRAELAQMCNQGRAEEAGSALLVDDEVARHGRKLFFDVVKLLGLALHPAVS